MIRTHGLTKTYRSVRAVDAIDLDVREGDVYGFLGANGSGKTTTVRMLLGLVLATAGEVELFGEPMPRAASSVLPRIGALVEGPGAYPHLSGHANLAVFDAAAGPRVARRRRRARIDEVLEQVGLDPADQRPAKAYSLGMRQRLGLAAALMRRPPLLVLDEPTNGLDPAARDDMIELVRRIGHDFGIAVLVTSHLLGELERVSEHVVVLDGGRLLRSSATSEFLDNTGTLLVEVLGGATERDRLGKALYDAGFACQPRGNVVAVDPPPADETRNVLDMIRDTAVDLGLGLVRIQPDHHRIEDIFREEVAGAVQPH